MGSVQRCTNCGVSAVSNALCGLKRPDHEAGLKLKLKLKTETQPNYRLAGSG